MLEPIQDTQYLEIFTEVLERFEDVYAIYDKNYNLIFANSAGFDAMPVYFKAMSEGLEVWDAHCLQIRSFQPTMSDADVSAYTDVMVNKFRSHTVYEVGVTKGRRIQVRHESLNEHYTLALGIDVTNMKAHQVEMENLAQENHRLAFTDQLTGLANRRQFIHTLNNRIVECRSTGKTFHVGLMDLNGFKRVNDIYGHAIGDSLLTGIAKRAMNFVGELAFLARLGGDEFAFILDTDDIPQGLSTYSAKLSDTLKAPIHLSGNDISVSASMGWVAYPTHGETASCLLKKSDYALYKSKLSKSRKAVVFSTSDENRMNREMEISQQLETADLESELYLEFQPIFNTQRNLVTGLEALVRWNSPVLGLVTPDEFIPLAEKTGYISDLTKIILKRALQNAVHWPKSIDLHVNISAIDLGKTDVISDLIHIIKTSNYSLQSVVFEVTETAVVDTYENTSKSFELLKENGLRLALDDFGMGFSSLSYLAQIPVTCLKIDRHFSQRLKPNSADEQILKTITFLCHNLNLDCIVEGVETQQQYDQLMSLGLTHMQGFHFSKGLKPQELAAFILRGAKGRDLRRALDSDLVLSPTEIGRAS